VEVCFCVKDSNGILFLVAYMPKKDIVDSLPSSSAANWRTPKWGV